MKGTKSIVKSIRKPKSINTSSAKKKNTTSNKRTTTTKSKYASKPKTTKKQRASLGKNVIISFVKPTYGTSTKKIQINRNRSYTLKKHDIYYYHRNDTIVLSKRKGNPSKTKRTKI